MRQYTRSVTKRRPVSQKGDPFHKKTTRLNVTDRLAKRRPISKMTTRLQNSTTPLKKKDGPSKYDGPSCNKMGRRPKMTTRDDSSCKKTTRHDFLSLHQTLHCISTFCVRRPETGRLLARQMVTTRHDFSRPVMISHPSIKPYFDILSKCPTT